LAQGGEGWFETPTLKAGIHGGDPNWGFLVYFGASHLEAAIADVNRLGGTAEAQLTNQDLAGSVRAVIRKGCALDFISDSLHPDWPASSASLKNLGFQVVFKTPDRRSVRVREPA
jgi:hypothetical protein